MKKTILLIILTMFPVVSMANFDIGAKAGYTASKFNTNESDISSDLKSGLEVGAFMRIGDTFFIQTELMYSLDGGKLNINSNNTFTNYKVNQRSLDLGALLGFKIINNQIFSINIQGGVFASYLTDKGIDDALNEIQGRDFKNFIYGAKLGIGADLSNFSLDIRYVAGLNDIYQAQSGFQDFDIKKSKIEVAIGLKLLSF